MTPYELEIRAAAEDGVTLVELGGELDLTNVPEVEQRLEELDSGEARVVLDLNRVTFLDSAALHMLFRLARRVGGRDRFGIVLEPNALLSRLVSMVGLEEVATMGATADEFAVTPRA